MAAFHGTLQPQPFEVAVSDKQLDQFKQLLQLSPIGPVTFENSTGDASFGISREWLVKARNRWLSEYDWRKTEARINAFENYKTAVNGDDGNPYDVHFLALRSRKENAIPVVLLHGWPGSPLEFLPLLELAGKKYTLDELPYTFIVPSLPGYGFSGGPSLKEQSTCESMASTIANLMDGLGYDKTGYVAQGGDIGSFVARILAARYPSCKAVHLNFAIMPPPEGVTPESVDAAESEGLARGGAFVTQGDAYARAHGQRPATIGLLLATSPLALLAWIGEKFLDWVDQPLELDHILDHVTLYWFTETMARGIYPYRQFFGPSPEAIPLKHYVEKPMGYSWLPKEIAPTPKAWVATTGNLVWHRQHTSGGHFAALEKPTELLADIEDFVAQVWS